MAREQGLFSIDDVLDALSTKLIGRHPHVFGDVKAEDAQQVLKNWEALKKEEKKKRAAANGHSADGLPQRLLDHVSSRMPALMEAQKISSKAAHAGFDWPHIDGLFEKLAEETAELQQQIERAPAESFTPQANSTLPEPLRQRLEDEVGDMFFVLVNIARYLSLDPESALRSTNRKFRRRFGWMEEQLEAKGKTLEQSTMEELESLWQEAKSLEDTAQ
jgi:MazG family protein